jgi:hypothetical protein
MCTYLTIYFALFYVRARTGLFRAVSAENYSILKNEINCHIIVACGLCLKERKFIKYTVYFAVVVEGEMWQYYM